MPTRLVAMDESSATLQSSGRASLAPQLPRTTLGRAFKRFRSALRIPSPSRRESVSPIPTPLSPLPHNAVVQQDENIPPASPTTELIEAGINLHNLVVDDEAEPSNVPADPIAPFMRGSLTHQQRTRELFEKYGLAFEPTQLASPDTRSSSRRSSGVPRVEKQIRMRIRYNCHRCQTTFGATSVCPECEHQRCRKCPRHPPKRARPRNSQTGGSQADRNGGGETDVDREAKRQRITPSSPISPEISSSSNCKTEPQILVPALLQICHKCQTTFGPKGSLLCEGCGHIRCSECSPEPIIADDDDQPHTDDSMPDRPLNEEFPPAERPDRVYREPRQRVRWICDQCQTVFLPDARICSVCLHTKCGNCTRAPPRPFLDLHPDPGIAVPLQEHLADLPSLHAPAMIASSSVA